MRVPTPSNIYGRMTCNTLLNPRAGILISLNVGIIWDLASMVQRRVEQQTHTYPSEQDKPKESLFLKH